MSDVSSRAGLAELGQALARLEHSGWSESDIRELADEYRDVLAVATDHFLAWRRMEYPDRAAGSAVVPRPRSFALCALHSLRGFAAYLPRPLASQRIAQISADAGVDDETLLDVLSWMDRPGRRLLSLND